jgi:tRNA U34 5-carboxymethylaminomethyl modifying enzyme MnmG/GidA
MQYLEESYDVVVVGAGHAGCEVPWHAPGWALRQLCLLSV